MPIPSTWAQKQEAVRLALAKALRMPDKATIGGIRNHRRVEWTGRESAQRWTQGGATADLRLGMVRSRGQVERRYLYDISEDTSKVTYGRHATFTVGVLVERDSQDPGEATVGTIAGYLRVRLHSEPVLAILRESDVAVVDLGQVMEADYEFDGRQVSAALVEIRFSTTEETMDDPEDDDGSYIATAEGEGQGDLEGVDFDTAD